MNALVEHDHQGPLLDGEIERAKRWPGSSPKHHKGVLEWAKI